MCRRHKKEHAAVEAKTQAGKDAKRIASQANKHFGIYARSLTDTQKALGEAIEHMDPTYELKRERVRYAQLCEYLQQIEAGTPPMYTVSEETIRDVVLDESGQPVGPVGKARVVRKREALTLDKCHTLMDRASGRITSIERRLAEAANAPRRADDPNETAQNLKKALQGIMQVTGGPTGEAAYEEQQPAKSGNGNGKILSRNPEDIENGDGGGNGKS